MFDPGVVKSFAQYSCYGRLAGAVRAKNEVYLLKVLKCCPWREARCSTEVYFGDHVPSFGLCLDSCSLTPVNLARVRCRAVAVSVLPGSRGGRGENAA